MFFEMSGICQVWMTGYWLLNLLLSHFIHHHCGRIKKEGNMFPLCL